MDPDVRAVVRQAALDLGALSADLEHVHDWDGELAATLRLQTIAAALVDAARHHAENLSRQAAGQRDAPPFS